METNLTVTSIFIKIKNTFAISPKYFSTCVINIAIKLINVRKQFYDVFFLGSSMFGRVLPDSSILKFIGLKKTEMFYTLDTLNMNIDSSWGIHFNK